MPSNQRWETAKVDKNPMSTQNLLEIFVLAFISLASIYSVFKIIEKKKPTAEWALAILLLVSLFCACGARVILIAFETVRP